LRILAYLIHTFLDPLGILPGIIAGLPARKLWQAGWGGAAAGAIVTAAAAYFHHSHILLRSIVTAAIVSAAWGMVTLWLRRWLKLWV
jgi:hypothetical protein